MAFTDYIITQSEIEENGIQSQPNRLTGTAAQNKAAFDKLITAVVKVKLNGLIAALRDTAAAGEIGITSIAGMTAGNVQAALEELLEQMQDITQGSVADGAITLAKLDVTGDDPTVTPHSLGCAKETHGHGISDISGAAAENHTHTLSEVSGLTAALDGKAASVHSHAQSDVTGLVTALAGKQDTLEADQVRHIFVVNSAPVSGAADGIYLVVENG